MLLYTYISRFSVTPHYQQQLYLRPSFITFFNFSHKWPTFAFTGERGYTHSALLKGSHTRAYTPKQVVFRMGVVSLPSIRAARSRTSPGRVSERRTLPLLGLGRGCSRRTQRAFGTAMCSCASLSRGVAAPLGCVICLQLGDVAVFFTLCAVLSERARWGWYHYPRRALRAAETLDGRLSKGLICRFLRLPSSTPCAVTFSANTQISLSAISVANTFALWYDKFDKLELQISLCKQPLNLHHQLQFPDGC